MQQQDRCHADRGWGQELSIGPRMLLLQVYVNRLLQLAVGRSARPIAWLRQECEVIAVCEPT
jgi:hypothetical protein